MTMSTARKIEVAFDDTLAAFEDQLIIGQEITKYKIEGGPTNHQRLNDKIWRPMPYIPAVYDGFNQAGNFGNSERLAVPVSVNLHKVATLSFGPKDGRDADSINQYFMDAGMSLASQLNRSVFDVASNWATLVSKRTVAATGFDDIADMSAIMVEQGLPTIGRKAFYSPRDYLRMASQLAKPNQSDSSLAATAYERAYVRAIGGFKVFENDQVKTLPAATATGVTITNAQPLAYSPKAVNFDVDGNPTNVDNRTQLISINVTAGTVKVGDAFVVAGVNSCHHISKADTGQQKTHRIMEIVTGAGGTGTVRISPPFISGALGGRVALENRNIINAPVNGAVVTFLNTVTAPINLFFQERAIEIIPGTYAVNSEDGWSVVMKGVTPKLGVPMTYTRQGDINDLSVKGRLEIDYGLGATQPEMIGMQIFNQT